MQEKIAPLLNLYLQLLQKDLDGDLFKKKKILKILGENFLSNIAWVLVQGVQYLQGNKIAPIDIAIFGNHTPNIQKTKINVSNSNTR